MALATLDLLAAVIADGAAHLGGLDGLAVDASGAGAILPAGGLASAGPQGIDDLLPSAIALPGGEVVPGGALGHEVVGQVVPLAAGACLVEQGVDDLAQVRGAGAASRLRRRQQGFDQLPLGVGQVRMIRLAHNGGLRASRSVVTPSLLSILWKSGLSK